MDYSNDAGLPCFCPHKVLKLDIEIQVSSFHSKGLWKSRHMRVHIWIHTPTPVATEILAQKDTEPLNGCVKNEILCIQKSWWYFNGGIQYTYIATHVERCLLAEARAFPSNKCAACCLLYVLAQNGASLTGVTTTAWCEQLVPGRTVTTMKLSPNDTEQNPFLLLQGAASSEGCLFTMPKL